MAGLYDDVAGADLVSEETEELRRKVAVLAEEAGRLREALQDAEGRASAAEESVGILERNMSALFNTARLDLARKELETKALTAAVERERRLAALQQEGVRAYLTQLQGAHAAMGRAFPSLGDGLASSGLTPDQAEAVTALSKLLSLAHGPQSAEELDAVAPLPEMGNAGAVGALANAPGMRGSGAGGGGSSYRDAPRSSGGPGPAGGSSGGGGYGSRDSRPPPPSQQQPPQQRAPLLPQRDGPPPHHGGGADGGWDRRGPPPQQPPAPYYGAQQPAQGLPFYDDRGPYGGPGGDRYPPQQPPPPPFGGPGGSAPYGGPHPHPQQQQRYGPGGGYGDGGYGGPPQQPPPYGGGGGGGYGGGSGGGYSGRR